MSKSWSTVVQKDMRTDASGSSIGQLAAPGSTIANPGSIAIGTGDYGNVSLNLSGKFKAGLSGSEVKDIVTQVGSVADSAISKVTDFANTSLAAATTAKTGELPNWQKYIPWIIVAIAGVAIVRRSRT